jgi:hypothetical protein
VLVAESVTPVAYVMRFGLPETHERREVPIPRFLLEPLAGHVEGKAAGDLVFLGGRGGIMRSQTSSVQRSTGPRPSSACPASIHTNCGTPRRLWPSRRAPM